jgi:hypothetical protein
MKLNLESFFRMVEGQAYVVIKPSDILPDYRPGSDIDIFCYNTDMMAQFITNFLSHYVGAHSEIKVVDNSTKMHIDYIIDNDINFRFDLYKCLPCYKNISIKSGFFSSVVEGAIEATFNSDVNSEEFIIKIPSKLDDFILRYIEYHEYYAQRPDKIKHIDYINDKIPKGTVVLALDKLHFYTSFPEPIYIENTPLIKFKKKITYYFGLIFLAKNQFRKLSFKEFILKVLSKLR